MLDRLHLLGVGLFVAGFLAFTIGLVGLLAAVPPSWSKVLTAVGGFVGFFSAPLVVARDLLLRAVGITGSA